MKPIEVEVGGHRFLVPPYMIGMVDTRSSWGMGIEQMERGFMQRVIERFGQHDAALRADEILQAAATKAALENGR